MLNNWTVGIMYQQVLVLLIDNTNLFKCSVLELVPLEEALVCQSPVYESLVKAFEREARSPLCAPSL